MTLISTAVTQVEDGLILAHPVTGDTSSGAEVAIAVIGGVIVLAGLLLVVVGRRKTSERQSAVWRLGGPSILVGVLALAFGPSLVPTSVGCSRPETQAQVEILSPTDGEVLQTARVPVQMRLTGARLSETSSLTNRPDEGHLHTTLDGKLMSMTSELSQEIDMPAGEHELEVEFVANDHAPFCSRVSDQVSFSVRPSTPPSS